MPRKETIVKDQEEFKINQIQQLAIEQGKTVSNELDPKTELEINLLNDAKDEADHRKKKRRLTRNYVGRLFVLVVSWLIFVGVVVGFVGFRIWEFSLSDNVLIALITSTTATVIGLFHYVAKWLYATNESDDKKDNKK